MRGKIIKIDFRGQGQRGLEKVMKGAYICGKMRILYLEEAALWTFN
jgi:hypothetical protein